MTGEPTRASTRTARVSRAAREAPSEAFVDPEARSRGEAPWARRSHAEDGEDAEHCIGATCGCS